MLTLDRNAPMSVTYGPDTAVIPFYQEGLYFDRQGKLVDMPHNRAQVALRGMKWEDAVAEDAAPTAPEQAIVAPPAAPQVVAPSSPDDGLGGKSAAQIFAISQKLRAELDVEGDGDPYVPTLENTDGNLEFVRRHLKGE